MMHTLDSPPMIFDADANEVHFNYLFDQILAVIALDEKDHVIRAKTKTSLDIKNFETNAILASIPLDLWDFA